MFHMIYAQIISDNNSQKMTKFASQFTELYRSIK